MNELLWLLFAVLDLCMVLAVFRFFGRTGLFALIVFNLLICNLQVMKTVELFGLTTTLGNILYASVFLSTDMISEFFGKKDAKKAVMLGFVALIMMVGYMQLALLFQPSADDFAQPHLAALFGFMPRIALGSLCAYLVSQMHDVWAFHYLKEKTGGKHLWLRNNLSTMFSQLLDSVVFCLIAFWGLFPTSVLVEIVVSTYLVKLLVAALDTPFIYLAKHLFGKQPATA